MDALNGTIFTIARPQIIGDLHATPDEAAWVNLGYLIAKLSVLPAASWIVDRCGETRVLFWSVMLVLLASIGCALAPDLAPLIAMRIVQGAAGAALLVSAQAILFHLFAKTDQPLVQAVFALGVVMAPTSAAPAIQGVLIDDLSWVWVFWLNPVIALGALSLIIPFRHLLPNGTRTQRPFDHIGFVLLSLAIAALVYILVEGPRWNWFEDAHIVFWALIGIGALAVFVGWRVVGQNRRQVIDRSIFADAHFAFGFLVSFVAGFALFGSAFLIPAFALGVLHMTPTEAGLLLAPSSLAVGMGLLVAGGLIKAKNRSPLIFVPLGIGLVMAAMWLLAGSNLTSGSSDLGLGLLIRGLGLGILFLAITLITLKDLAPHLVASGIGLFNFGRQMGGIIGISFLQTYLNRQIALNRLVLAENLDPARLPFDARQEAIAGVLISRGYNPGLANEGAAAVLQNVVQGQVAVLSFNEAFFSLVLLFVIAVPVILSFKLMQKLTQWGAA